jgi:transcription elongation factor GreB
LPAPRVDRIASTTRHDTAPDRPASVTPPSAIVIGAVTETTYASFVSKAFTKDDRPDEPVVVRHRPPLPDGVPNYITRRGLEALRTEVAAAEPGARRSELERRIATAVQAPPPTDRDEIRFGAHVTTRGQDGQLRQVQIVGVDEAEPAVGLVAFLAPLARALLGRRVGDLVTVRAPGGTEDLEIRAVAYDDE